MQCRVYIKKDDRAIALLVRSATGRHVLVRTDRLGVSVTSVLKRELLKQYAPQYNYPVKKAFGLLTEYVNIFNPDTAQADAQTELTKFKSNNPNYFKEVTKMATPKPKSRGKYPTAASMFKALIMEGKKTDEAIFTAVQKKFGLTDDKRNYVGIYRGKLKQAGQDVPPRKLPRRAKTGKPAA